MAVGKLREITRSRADRLFSDTQSLARSPWALVLVFAAELTGCTLIPLPIELLLIALVSTVPRRWARFVLSAALGSVVGGIVLYGVGRLFFNSVGVEVINWYGAGAQWKRTMGWFQGGWGLSFMVLSYFTTGLFRVASLGAGFTRVSLPVFVLLLVSCRSIRFSLEGLAMKCMGRKFEVWIKRYYPLATAISVVLFFAALIVARVAARR